MEDNTEIILRRVKTKLALANRKKRKEEIKEEIEKSLEKIKGKDGEDGYTPVKGKDYYTPEEIKEIKKEVTPVKGKDYFDGKDGKSIVGPRGPIGPRGPRGLKGEPGENGKSIKGPKGDKGEDGSPDTPYEIRDKLSTLKGNERLDAKAIKNLEKQIDLKITSLGGSSGGSSTEVDPVYTADKSNIVFSYNGDVALEYTGDDITKITKNVDGTITETDLAYEYTGGLLTKLTKTKDGVSKYKTLTYTGTQLTNISAWSEV